jgi:hypothetical protein
MSRLFWPVWQPDNGATETTARPTRMVSHDPIKDYMQRHDCGFAQALDALAAQLNRVQFETRRFQFRSSPSGRPWKVGTTGFKLDAVARIIHQRSG